MRRKQARTQIQAKAITETFDPRLWLATTALSAAVLCLAFLI